MHDVEFVRRMKEHVALGEGQYLGTSRRMVGMLTLAEEELQDCPLFYEISTLSKTIHCTNPPLVAVRSAILNAGYRVSLSHVCSKSIKTDAPPSVIWDIMRVFAKGNNVKLKEPDTVAGKLLRKEPTLSVNFDIHPKAVLDKNVMRFPPNPEPNWGPKARAGKRKPNGGSDIDRPQKNPKKEAERDLKQFSCRRFEEGTCDLGDNCRYSHPAKQENTGDMTVGAS